MDAGRPRKGWHLDPSDRQRWRYFDGHRWSGFVERRDAGSGGRYTLRGWRRLWYWRVVKLPFVFYPLAWLDCSVPLTRRHLGWLLRPAEARPPFLPDGGASEV